MMSRNLRIKVTFSVVLPLVLILGTIIAVQYNRQKDDELADLSLLAAYSGQVIEFNLRHAMMRSDFGEVRALLNMISESQEFQNVYIMDPAGEVIFAPNDMDKDTQMDTNQADCQPCHHLPPEARPSSIVVTNHDNQRVFRSMKPIENRASCAECHDSDERILGVLVTDISMIPLETTLADSLWEYIRWGITTILVTVLVVNVVLSHFVLRRLEGLATAIAGLGKGFLPPPLPEGQADEIGQLASAFNIMSQQIEARETENRNLSASLRRESLQRGELLKRLITSQEDERKRIARELHDDLGQSLTGLELRTGVLKQLVNENPSRAQSQLEEIQTLVTDATDRMYNLILDLRPSVLDDLGLAAALKLCADRVLAGTGISFVLDSDALSGRIHPTLETTVYRIFQEALNNVVRHAQATQVSVELLQHNGLFQCTIADNGQGFDPQTLQLHHYEPRGLGLLGMQERMAQCGGQLEIISQPGGGTRLTIHVPLKELPCE